MKRVLLTVGCLLATVFYIQAQTCSGTVCATANEGEVLTLTAPPGAVITSITFASYGTPNGTCGNFTLGSCQASTSKSVVEGLALNQNSVSIPAENYLFGDPCIFTVKRLYVEAVWTMPTLSYYVDADGDGYGDPAHSIVTCSPPNGYVANGLDCKDNDKSISPGAPEIIGDGIDNNCNGVIDEKILNALSFDGVNDYVLVPDKTINDLPSGTIEAWVFLNSVNDETICAKQWNGINTFAAFSVGSYSNIAGLQQGGAPGKVYFHGHNWVTNAESKTILSAGRWYHLAATFNTSKAEIYINGKLDNSVAGDFSLPNAFPVTGTTIGAWLGDYANSYLNGKIDEFRIWNVVRTQAEIQADMNSVLSGNTPGLVAYFPFNQGNPGGTNTTIFTAYDATSNHNDGTLHNFALAGASSNWVAGAPNVISNVSVVNITSPANSATYLAPANVPLVADASTPNGKIKSVDFYNGSTLLFTEYNYPYSRKWTNVPAGDYTITAVATDDTGGTVTSAPVQIHVVTPAVTGFTLVNAISDKDIQPITDGSILYKPGSPQTWNIRANTAPNKVGSVVFILDGQKVRTENGAPYSLAGDDPPTDYRGWVLPLGNHSLTAIPYSQSDGNGLAGDSLTVHFSVVAPNGNNPGPDFIYVGTLNGHDYYKSVKMYNWQQADALALSLGGHMVAITSQAENDWLVNNAFKLPTDPDSYWIGLTDAAREGTFVWSDGEPATYTNFNIGEPNDLGGEDYVQLYRQNGKWNDLNGLDQMKFILEFDVTTVRIVNITSPGNGATYQPPADILLAAEALTPKGKIKSVDFYSGSTLLFTEYNYPYSRKWTNVPLGDYTITAVAKDDTGGIITSAPVQIHVAPQAGGPNFIYMGTLNGHDYYKSVNAYTWQQADALAVSLGGHMVSITSQAENDWVYANAFKDPSAPNSYWIGLNDVDNEGTFVWSDGEPVTYLNFSDGEPNNYFPDQDYCQIYGQNGKWDDFFADGELGFILEFDVTPVTTINITSPLNDATYSAPADIPLIAQAFNPKGPIKSVDFYNGSTFLFTEYNYPYSRKWTNVPAGDYTITAVATDDTGGTVTSAPVQIHVVTPAVTGFALVNAISDKDIQPITDGSILYKPGSPQTLNIRANTFPNKVGSVVFILDGQKVRTENGAPYALAGDNPPGDYHGWTLPLGNHTLTAIPYSSYNGNGQAGNSLTIHFTVVAGNNIPPIVKITSPADSSAFRFYDLGDPFVSLHVTADASDPDGTIQKVVIYGPDLWEDASSETGTYWADFFGSTSGTYSLYAVATDNDGIKTTSDTIRVRIGAYYPDLDGDGYGAGGLFDANKGQYVDNGLLAFTRPPGYVDVWGDCNDNDPKVHPNGSEPCNGIDANCDGYACCDGVEFNVTTQKCSSCGVINNPDREECTACGIIDVKHVACTSCGEVAFEDEQCTECGIIRNDQQCTPCGVISVDEVCDLATLTTRKSLQTTEKDISREVSIKLAPNPANNILNIHTRGWENAGQVIVSVISPVGSVVQAKQFTNPVSNFQLDVSHLAKGVYTIRLLSGKKVLYKQFIKL